MTSTDALKLTRLARLALISRGRCGAWVPGSATVCARVARHGGTCGYRQEMAA